MTLPLVLLFGRTNVGKSTLFNRLSHSRMAVVYDQPGVTRDFLETVVDQRFRLMDSGGLFMPTDAFSQTVEARVENALKQAAVVVWVVDGRTGLAPMEQTLAEAFRKWKQPPILAVNKVDRADDEASLADFYQLGWPVMVPISAEHNRGIDALKAAILEALPVRPEVHGQQSYASDPACADRPDCESALPATQDENVATDEEDASARSFAPVKKPIRFVVLGRPNVGKSSLTNALLKQERVLVSDVAGTTRDAVECPFTWKFRDGATANFVLVDTAGVRKKTTDPVEFYASVRRQSALDASDLAIVLLDATVGPTLLDKTLLSAVWDAGKGCLLVVNKWDLARDWCRKEQKSAAAFEADFRSELRRVCPFMDELPIVFVSAHTGDGLASLLKTVKDLWQRLQMPLTTGVLNRCLQVAQKKQPPPLVSNRKRFKLYYAVQLSGLPITLKVFCNRVAWLPPPYVRFLERQVRQTFHLNGCPLRWEWVEKKDNCMKREKI